MDSQKTYSLRTMDDIPLPVRILAWGAGIFSVAIITAILYSFFYTQMPKLETWFKQEEAFLALLPKPPVGNDGMRLNADFLIVAQETHALIAVDEEGTWVEDRALDSKTHIVYSAPWYQPLFPWQKLDADRVDYIVLLLGIEKHWDTGLTDKLYISHGFWGPFGWHEVSKSPYPGSWSVDKVNVYVIRRDDHKLVFARNINPDSLTTLLEQLALHGTQCGASRWDEAINRCR
jgi:hypothetical protein